MSVPLLAGLAAAVLLPACTPNTNARVYAIGERVQVGPLTYAILDAEWLDHLGQRPAPRLPQRRFLALRVSVTNSGTAPLGIPTMILQSAGGQEYAELADVQDLPEALGLLRTLKPAETEQGWAVFDVPTGSYKLRLAAGADPGGPTALIDIPLVLPNL